MLNRLLAYLLGLLLLAGIASAATLLPMGKQTFLDANGAPLAYGSVQFYIPGTTTPKNTWTNSAQTALNTNPVKLDGSGRAIIYGSGTYREVVSDVNGTQQWDQTTSDTSANNFSWAALSGGAANAQTLSAPNFTQADGQQIGLIASVGNTSALTFSVNNGTPINVVKDLSSGPIALSGGEVVSQNEYTITYDASLGEFHLGAFPAVPGIGAALPIVSAATTDIGTFSTHDAMISGAASITSLGASASVAAPLYMLQFSGTPTLVNSGTLLTPTGANIVAAAGDTAIAVYLGAGSWHIISYSNAGVPSAAVMAFNLSGCPAGWSPANGSGGTVNLVGYFIRGLDTAGVVDPTHRTLASIELDALQTFTVPVTVNANPTGQVAGTGGAPVPTNSGYTYNSGAPSSPARLSTETRPVNVALLYCQKN